MAAGPSARSASGSHFRIEVRFMKSSTPSPDENRAERAFHGGPHCHVNVHSDNAAFPSHMAHLASGPGNVFNAVPCPE